MGKYNISPADPWTWSRAGHEDVEGILNLVAQNYQDEINGILVPDRPRMAYHLHRAILQQIFEEYQVLLTVAKDKTTNAIIAWAWLERGKFTVYATEELASAEFAHVELSQSLRNKVKLTAQILEQWIEWCRILKIPVLTSSSIRDDQKAFMRLHEQFGFLVRGSIAYKKIGDGND